MAEDCILDHQPWHKGKNYEQLFRNVYALGPHEFRSIWMRSYTVDEFADAVEESARAARQYGLGA